MPAAWLTAVLAGVLIGVLVWLCHQAGVYDERERARRRDRLDDHERRLQVIEDYVITLLGHEPSEYEPSEDDEWTN